MIIRRPLLLEQVALLSSQATAAVQQGKPEMIRAAIEAIANTAKTITGIARAWQVCEPLLKKIFGIE
jgi:phage shock protein A